MDTKVEVHGLREFQKALREADRDFPKELRAAHKDAATTVKNRAQLLGMSGPGVTPKAAASLRISAEARGAAIKIGGTKAPYALGAEFGSLRFKQFQPWRGNQWDDGMGPGYFLHPSIRASREKVLDDYGNAVDRLMRKAFPE